MPTKLEAARETTKEFLSKDTEISVLAETLKKIENRTTDGYLTVALDDGTKLTVPAFVIHDVFRVQKEEKDAELEALADKFNGK